jgi:hypothetical protein
MVARIDWVNNFIDRMLAGKRPLTPEQWGMRDSIMAKDVDLLRQAAPINSLRPGAAEPDRNFIASLRERVLLEAAGEE